MNLDPPADLSESSFEMGLRQLEKLGAKTKDILLWVPEELEDVGKQLATKYGCDLKVSPNVVFRTRFSWALLPPPEIDFLITSSPED